MQVTMRSGLSMTAPNETASAYPSSPPSWIAPGVSALMWLQTISSALSFFRLKTAEQTLETPLALRTE
jgi:hypothetical protein